MEELLSEKVAGVSLIIFVGIIFPGFVALKTYSLFRPLSERKASDLIVEVSAYGLINFVLSYGLLEYASQADTPALLRWFLVVCCFLIGPALIAWLFYWGQRRLSDIGILLRPHSTPWDDFFSTNEPCWILVHLPDGKKVGGKFFEKSRASLHPKPGHLYIEELWKVSDDGRFIAPVSQSKGLILRPSDYSLVEFFKAE